MADTAMQAFPMPGCAPTFECGRRKGSSGLKLGAGSKRRAHACAAHVTLLAGPLAGCIIVCENQCMHAYVCACVCMRLCVHVC